MGIVQPVVPLLCCIPFSATKPFRFSTAFLFFPCTGHFPYDESCRHLSTKMSLARYDDQSRRLRRFTSLTTSSRKRSIKDTFCHKGDPPRQNDCIIGVVKTAGHYLMRQRSLHRAVDTLLAPRALDRRQRPAPRAPHIPPRRSRSRPDRPSPSNRRTLVLPRPERAVKMDEENLDLVGRPSEQKEAALRADMTIPLVQDRRSVRFLLR